MDPEKRGGFRPNIPLLTTAGRSADRDPRQPIAKASWGIQDPNILLARVVQPGRMTLADFNRLEIGWSGGHSTPRTKEGRLISFVNRAV